MAANLNRIAPFYDPLLQLVYGNILKEAKRSFLNNIPLSVCILFMGGNGKNNRGLQELIWIEEYPYAAK
jgi:hypothetical protein